MTVDLVGRLLAERYDVLELLGTGGMGAVYRAHDRELDELVALKLIHPQLAASPRFVERFRREVKLARRVTHRNVARTFELVHAGAVMFCTMELVDGESLRGRLERGPSVGPRLAAWIASEVCAALAAAHAAGVVHRDIKPDNILLATDGRVVLADFGVAVLGVPGQAVDVSGTPEYMAPEQARGEPATAATDVYAVGVVLYEMLSGRRAFSGDSHAVLAAKRDHRTGALVLAGGAPELVRIVARATAHDPADRIRSVAELAALLAPLTEGKVAGAGPVSGQMQAVRMHDVTVVAPRGETERVHLAQGVHDQLLHRLARRPRIRVLPRYAAPAPSASEGTVVELFAAEQLTVAITAAGATRTLSLPLAVEDIDAAAELIATAVADRIARPTGGESVRDARELQLRAVAAGRAGLTSVREALALSEQALALQPDDPDIVATHALAYIRHAIAAPTIDLEAARDVVRAAIGRAHHRAEPHVAAGHLELHTGEAPRAATHYRTAIACSRYVPDGHDGLGRLLLEAGFLEQAMARIDDALAIAPSLVNVRWEVARAHALEGQWEAHDAIVADLADVDRPAHRLRAAWWRGDLATLARMRDADVLFFRFEPELFAMLFAIALEGGWSRHRDALVTVVEDRPRARRRQATIAQFATEAAYTSGDLAVGERLLANAIDHGLYDLHWLDRCPTLDAGRATPEFARLHARVKRRAEAILDALYGDNDAETAVF
jgi:eukaryotic-like serine/threonine-protein kinase